MNILMTGAGGLIGSRIRLLLRHRFNFRAVDIKRVEDETDSHVVDITKLSEVEPLMEGVDAVMHLAIASAKNFEGRPDEFDEAQLDVNVKGTYNVLEAAVRASVKRVVCASSVMVNWGYGPGTFVSLKDPARPNCLYAATKYFTEVLSEMYAREHGLPVICWRIGQPADHTQSDVKSRASMLDRGVMVSFVDVANGFAKAIDNETVHFGVYNLVSDNPDCYCETTRARLLLACPPVLRLRKSSSKSSKI